MKQIAIATMADFLPGTAGPVEIINPVNSQVVRLLNNFGNGKGIHVLCGDGTEAAFAADAPVRYRAWVFDRGSLLVDLNGEEVKICTEFDILRIVATNETMLIVPSTAPEDIMPKAPMVTVPPPSPITPTMNLQTAIANLSEVRAALAKMNDSVNLSKTHEAILQIEKAIAKINA